MMNVRMLIGILAISLIAGAFHNPTAPRTRKRLLGNSFGGPGNASYEYIVVGAGNAGLPLAVRLAEGGHSVAVIEAGSFYEFGNSNYSQIPWLASTFTGKDISQESPQVDWGFQTVPQKASLFFIVVTGQSAETTYRGSRGKPFSILEARRWAAARLATTTHITAGPGGRTRNGRIW